VEIYTIGFTKRTAAQFFGALRQHGVRRLIDVRLNNSSQLAGFSKRSDLPYFLQQICGAEYVHEPLLAPTQELLDAYRKHRKTWETYEVGFLELLAKRRVETALERSSFDSGAVLLCSEPVADRCHRRLVAEYLQRHWRDLDIVHL
jgi:uncharacterized protein (DUF488 family)